MNMEPMNNLLKPSEIKILENLIGDELYSYQYDELMANGNQIFEVIGLMAKKGIVILDNEVIWMDNYFSGGDYIPHLKITKAKSAEVLHISEPSGKLIVSSVKEKIKEILLVQDHIKILENGNLHQYWDSTEGVILRTESKDYAFYKENTWLDENMNVYKGHDVLSKLEPLEKHWNVFAKPFCAFAERKLVSLSTGEEKLLGTCKIAGEDCGD